MSTATPEGTVQLERWQTALNLPGMSLRAAWAAVRYEAMWLWPVSRAAPRAPSRCSNNRIRPSALRHRSGRDGPESGPVAASRRTSIARPAWRQAQGRLPAANRPPPAHGSSPPSRLLRIMIIISPSQSVRSRSVSLLPLAALCLSQSFVSSLSSSLV
ncbi:hypothetical protein VTN96DRAFT_1214 [Rasamsonia emersonii]